MKSRKNKRIKEGSYWCLHCGEENSIRRAYTQVEYGSVDIDKDGEFGDDYDVSDYDDFNAREFFCKCCAEQANSFDALASDDWNEVCRSLAKKEKRKEI